MACEFCSIEFSVYGWLALSVSVCHETDMFDGNDNDIILQTMVEKRPEADHTSERET